jgi:hypothetical protein
MVHMIHPALNAAPAKTGAIATPSVAQDRRRPGRAEQVSSALIPLLREPAHGFDTHLNIDTDPLAPARAILVGSLVSVPLWTLIGLGVWLFF